jgi:energy-coupling factor transport system ATP-binding protein
MDEAIDADRIIVMSDGDILLDGTPREVFRDMETLRGTGLDIPETAVLLHELKADGFDVSLDALSVDECAEAIYGAIKQWH